MTKRKYKLKKMVGVVPILKGISRDQAVDNLAFEAMQSLSSTPIKRFTFVTRRPSGLSPIADNLEYSAWGTPKEE